MQLKIYKHHVAFQNIDLTACCITPSILPLFCTNYIDMVDNSTGPSIECYALRKHIVNGTFSLSIAVIAIGCIDMQFKNSREGQLQAGTERAWLYENNQKADCIWISFLFRTTPLYCSVHGSCSWALPNTIPSDCSLTSSRPLWICPLRLWRPGSLWPPQILLYKEQQPQHLYEQFLYTSNNRNKVYNYQ